MAAALGLCHISSASNANLTRWALISAMVRERTHTYPTVALGADINPRIVSGRPGRSTVVFIPDG
jgi:hypothetical protein